MRPNRFTIHPLRFRRAALISATLAIALALGVFDRAAAEPTRIPPTLGANGEGDILTGVWPRAMALDSANNLWVANGFEGTVVRISESTGKPLEAPIKVGNQPTSLVWLDATKTMWVASYDDASLIPIEPDGKGVPTAREAIPLGDSRPVAMAVSGGAIWVITQIKDSQITKDNLIKFNPATKQVESRLTVGRFPTTIISSASDVTPDDRTLFIANGHDDSVSVVDTRLEGGKGKITVTYTDGVPAFPFALVFDGTFLWIGSYECKYENDKCMQSQIGRINVQTGKTAPPTEALSGRQVYLSFLLGHVMTAGGNGEGIADVNSVTAQANLRIMKAATNGRGSYYGTALLTKNFIYIADWTNDRVIRIKAPGPITVPPTPTALPPTATFTPAPPCNPDPKFQPRLAVGETARVIDDKFQKPLRIRKETNFGDDVLTGKQFKVGDQFTILAGPFGNNKPLDPKTNPDPACFYQVKGLKDDDRAGFVTEGGLNSDKGDKRYFIEKVPDAK